jgi:hypothetical protein
MESISMPLALFIQGHVKSWKNKKINMWLRRGERHMNEALPLERALPLSSCRPTTYQHSQMESLRIPFRKAYDGPKIYEDRKARFGRQRLWGPSGARTFVQSVQDNENRNLI